MGNKKIRDVCLAVREYQDRNTGETKKAYKNVGALMQNDEDGSYFILLERTFNPAGAPNKDGKDTVLLSCFIPQDQREQNGGASQSAGRQQSYADASGGSAGQREFAPIEDDIDF